VVVESAGVAGGVWLLAAASLAVTHHFAHGRPQPGLHCSPSCVLASVLPGCGTQLLVPCTEGAEMRGGGGPDANEGDAGDAGVEVVGRGADGVSGAWSGDASTPREVDKRGTGGLHHEGDVGATGRGDRVEAYAADADLVAAAAAAADDQTRPARPGGEGEEAAAAATTTTTATSIPAWRKRSVRLSGVCGVVQMVQLPWMADGPMAADGSDSKLKERREHNLNAVAAELQVMVDRACDQLEASHQQLRLERRLLHTTHTVLAELCAPPPPPTVKEEEEEEVKEEEEEDKVGARVGAGMEVTSTAMPRGEAKRASNGEESDGDAMAAKRFCCDEIRTCDDVERQLSRGDVYGAAGGGVGGVLQLTAYVEAGTLWVYVVVQVGSSPLLTEHPAAVTVAVQPARVHDATFQMHTPRPWPSLAFSKCTADSGFGWSAAGRLHRASRTSP
jgi:hypothetical protein